jgi:uncharacterized protein (TIGR03437 family)
MIVSSIPNARVGSPYSQRLVSGGSPPYAVLLSGNLPPGIVVDPKTGELSGTPNLPATVAFTVSVSDNANPPNTPTQLVRLSVLPPGPDLIGVTNAASYQAGPIAPGEILTLFGAGIGPSNLVSYNLDAQARVSNELSGTRLLFDGVPAPLLYVSASQLSAIAPYELEGKTKTQIEVKYNGVRSPTSEVSVAPAAAGIFAADGSGKGQAAALNQDATVNSSINPADTGSVLVLFATGEGQTDPREGRTGSSMETFRLNRAYPSRYL